VDGRDKPGHDGKNLPAIASRCASVINNSWNAVGLPSVAIAAAEVEMSSKNIIAIFVIVAVMVGGGAALYKFDNGQGNRTPQTIANKTASD
jgi:hypothetical protein